MSQLVEKCVNLNRIADEFGPNDGDAVFVIVRQLVSEVAGVDESKISADTRFIHDLGF